LNVTPCSPVHVYCGGTAEPHFIDTGDSGAVYVEGLLFLFIEIEHIYIVILCEFHTHPMH
jgi:hypothetical protein